MRSITHEQSWFDYAPTSTTAFALTEGESADGATSSIAAIIANEDEILSSVLPNDQWSLLALVEP